MVFTWLFAWTLRQAARNVWCLGAACVFVHAFFDYPFHKPQIAAIVFLMLAAGACSPQRRRERREFRNRGGMYTMASPLTMPPSNKQDECT